MRGGYGGQGGRRTPAKDRGKARRASDSSDNANGDQRGEDAEDEQPSSPRETIMLESSFPPQGDFPEDEDEDEEDEDDDALEVVVETLLGYTYRVRVSQWDTVAGLKALLYRTQGIPASHQHLLLGQTELLDDVCLMEQGVVDGSTLRLVLAMRGGPINARRLPTTQDDMFWREVTGFVDENKEDLWDGVGGRTVTLLVLRDGENVNLYRVIENEDGSFSPLNESWGSVGSSQAEEDALRKAQAADEEAMTRARMAELRARMDALKLKNRQAKKEKNAKQVTSEGREKHNTKSIAVQAEAATKNHLNLADSQEHRAGGSRPNTRQRSGSGGKRLKTVNRWGGRGSRPTTQERNAELRRNSISRTSTRLKEIPTAHPPIPVDWTGRKPLDDIRPADRKRLPAVNEERGKGSGQKPKVPSQVIGAQTQKSAYASYRKSLVRHGLVTNSGKEIVQDDKDSREAWPRREGPVPLYMPPQTARKSKRHEADPLYRSHNQDLLRTTQRTPNIRPKTSPEVLERRPVSMGGESAISDRIQIRAPDDRLRNGALVASGSREQRDILRGIMNSKGLGSRKTTPEEGRRRLGSGRHQSSPTHLPAVTPQKRKSRRKPRIVMQKNMDVRLTIGLKDGEC
ncbi:AN1-type zinc finger and ubiquitin domain-containing protein 1 [Penaeus vannamei]|uniref:AN1-type zinc finger and ubiquitin domain-containing protein 1 n=1 Tax=Penaeus vannamei TaxID=6689 RepID=A0A3R7MJM5_PENVA|nr:AN1-type zinc finger and ubiquitin domain-containing protein 1 [Penaeus vannamei]